MDADANNVGRQGSDAGAEPATPLVLGAARAELVGEALPVAIPPRAPTHVDAARMNSEIQTDRALADYALPAQAYVPVAHPYVVPGPGHYPLQAMETSSVVVAPGQPGVTIITPSMQPTMMPPPMAQPTSYGGLAPVSELAQGGYLVVGSEVYKVEHVVQPKPEAPPKDPTKKPARQAPKFIDSAPSTATAIFKDVWDGRETGRQPRLLLAGCHEALLDILTQLEDRSRRGKPLGGRRDGGFFRSSPTAKAAAPAERIDHLVKEGLLLKSVNSAASQVKLVPPADDVQRIGVSADDVDRYISLLWQLLEQGFDHDQWSQNRSAPAHRSPPPVPPANPPPKPPELPAGAAVLLPVSRMPGKSA